MFVDIFNLEETRFVSGVNTNFLNLFICNLRRNGKSEFSVFSFEVPRHRQNKSSVLNLDAGDNQGEPAFLAEIMRQLHHVELIRAASSLANQSEERLEAPVSDFQSLLCNVSAESFVVRAVFADMVITLVTEILTFSKVVLPNGVESFIVKVLREPAESS